MLMWQIESWLSWSDLVIVRLIRRWVAAREAGERRLPSLVELATELGQSPQAAVALHSLFQLTESCLGRPLQAECCCSRLIGADERAVLVMIAVAPVPGLPIATDEIPHGLPGALAWAVRSVRSALGDDPHPAVQSPPPRCPFGRSRSVDRSENGAK